MKKTLALVIVAMFVLGLAAGCGTSDGGGDDNTPVNQEKPATLEPESNNSDNNNNDDSKSSDSFDADRVIAVYTREEGSGTRDAFVSITGVGDDMYVEASVESETNQVLTKVEGLDTAIGYISVGSLSDSVKPLSVDGVTPSNETIKDGSYALQRPFLICYTANKADDELVQDFIAFILSAQGQEKAGTKWTTVDDAAPDYTPSGLSGTLKVGGSTSVEPLMELLREAYIELNPDVEIEISGGGSGAGIKEATEGIIDIGMSSRGLKDEEKAELTDVTIALDGVAVIVNPANPIDSITIEMIRQIFTGEITRWSEVG